MASSVCMGRAPNCGRRTANPMSATIMNAGHRAQDKRGAKAPIGGLAERVNSGRLAPDFNLDVIIQLVRRVPIAVKANVAALRTLGVDQLSLVGLDVIQILASSEAKLT